MKLNGSCWVCKVESQSLEKRSRALNVESMLEGGEIQDLGHQTRVS